MNYTDNQLKAALAKMLADELRFDNQYSFTVIRRNNGKIVTDTELLEICHRIEAGLSESDHADFTLVLYDQSFDEKRQGFDERAIYSPTWQQRTIALAEVKGVEI